MTHPGSPNMHLRTSLRVVPVINILAVNDQPHDRQPQAIGWWRISDAHAGIEMLFHVFLFTYPWLT